MRRPAPRLVPALGLVLCAGGAVLAWRAGTVDVPVVTPQEGSGAYASRLSITFDAAGTVRWSRTRLLAAAGALLGLVLLVGSAGRLLALRSPVRPSGRPVRPLDRRTRRGLLLGALGGLLVGAGIVLAVIAAEPADPVVTYTGSYRPLTCPDAPGCAPPAAAVALTGRQLTGLGLAAAGAVLLAGVSGWLLGRNSRADQG